MKDCKNCYNCVYIRGFMATCQVSFDEVRKDGVWHVQRGQDKPRKYANKCEHYTTEKYDRDIAFIL